MLHNTTRNSNLVGHVCGHKQVMECGTIGCGPRIGVLFAELLYRTLCLWPTYIPVRRFIQTYTK